MSNKKDNEANNDLAFLQQLSDWMHEADIHEVTLESEDKTVHVVRRGNVAVPVAPLAAPSVTPTAPAPAPATAPAAALVGEATTTNGHVELAPMVGVAYLAPSPNDDPFVSVGQPVRVGDPLLIIEAMKVMNQIQATKAGVVKEVLVQDGEPIEFDQPLVRID